MPGAPVIANNTPLVALWVLGRLDLLLDLYGEVLVPEMVRAEFLAVDRGQREAALAAAPWIITVPLSNPQHALAYTGLDQGEAAVLALAEERGAALVIMDERKGRRYSQRLGIPVAGTVAILLLAKERGLIAAIAPSLHALLEAGLYLSPLLVAQALSLAGEAE
jgi:uncharacterized protein